MKRYIDSDKKRCFLKLVKRLFSLFIVLFVCVSIIILEILYNCNFISIAFSITCTLIVLFQVVYCSLVSIENYNFEVKNFK